MDLKKGTINCINSKCKYNFVWVYQSVSKQIGKPIAYDIYLPKENEAIVNTSNFRCYCPNCGTPHILDEETVLSSH